MAKFLCFSTCPIKQNTSDSHWSHTFPIRHFLAILMPNWCQLEGLLIWGSSQIFPYFSSVVFCLKCGVHSARVKGWGSFKERHGEDKCKYLPQFPCLMDVCGGGHRTDDFSPKNTNFNKIKFCFIHILGIWLPQNFAHAMTAVLSWHVQNFVAICWPEMELSQTVISIRFDFWVENSWLKLWPEVFTCLIEEGQWVWNIEIMILLTL